MTQALLMKTLKPCILAGAVCLATGSLGAATSTWTGSVDSSFSNSANWTPAAPASGDALEFGSATRYTVDLTGASPNNGPLTFNSASDYLFTPASATFVLTGGITQNGAGAVTFENFLDVGEADRTLGGTGTGVVRFEGSINGFSGINVAGGVYEFAAFNGISGPVILSGGTLKVTQPGFGDLELQEGGDPLGYSAATNNGGRLELIAEDPLGRISVKRTNYFGPAGGTLVFSNFNLQIPGNNLNANVVEGPARIEAYPARLATLDPTGSSANDNLAGAFQLQNLHGTGPITLVLRNGAAARFQVQPVNDWTAPMFTGPIIIDGQPDGDVTADQDPLSEHGGTNIVYLSLNNISNPYHVPAGIYFKNACQLYFTHSNQRQLASDVTVTTNAAIAVQGRPSASSARTFDFGLAGGTNTLTIQEGGLAQMDLQLARWVNPLASVVMNSACFIDAGGTLRFARTYDGGGNVGNIAVNNTLTGRGTADKDAVIDLLLDNGTGTQNGVTFNAGANLVVNGSTIAGLRVQAKDAAALGNLVTAARLNALTGSAGVLTLALANNDTFTVPDGPSTAQPVSLGFDRHNGSEPTYVVSAAPNLANFQRLVVKGGLVKLQNGLSMPASNLRILGGKLALDDGSTATLAALVLSGDATLEVGTAAGAAVVLNFANSSAAAWTGTLTIANWNGDANGGGPDQIFFGTGAGGLTAAQLAQIKWINPFGAGDVTGASLLPSGEVVPLPPTTTLGTPAIVGGELQFSVEVGTPSQVSVVQRATNLNAPVFWENLATNTGSFTFTETGTASRPQAFYRVLVP